MRNKSLYINELINTFNVILNDPRKQRTFVLINISRNKSMQSIFSFQIINNVYKNNFYSTNPVNETSNCDYLKNEKRNEKRTKEGSATVRPNLSKVKKLRVGTRPDR